MSDVRFWRRRPVRRTAAWTVTAAVLAGGLFWVSGGYDSWRADRALDSACDGDLAAGAVRELFDGVSLTSSGGGGADRWGCTVSAADDDTDAGLVLWARSTDRLMNLEDADGFDAPLGHNWTGSFRFDPDDEDTDEARAVLLLNCGKESGYGRLMTADADLGRGGFDDPMARARLVAVLTETATAYTRRTDCAAPAGGRVKYVGVSTTRTDYKPVAAATGSCADLLDGKTAARWGVRTVREIAAAPAPLENCVLGGLRGAFLYGFTASYGPSASYARLRLSERRDDDTVRANPDTPNGSYALTARCPGAGGTALFQVDTLHDEDDPKRAAPVVDHQGLRAALQRFAERSAKTHGCETPRAV
ncbi:hypothetical protein OG473_23890 [Streptomyces anulatus]|uniref:hypothetical protein n=1 Tax=Streptomyces anulatus TaxID=1892 RepID=UPI0032497EE5|nr:hypothetical protein OG238_15800 [Streptomyces anulatus]WSU29528.1 hypothetical protein OG391_14430 [Streptomyces anulatus]WSU91598.1 hypothetical protein OG575_24385 [Streptomyces anulatus]